MPLNYNCDHAARRLTVVSVGAVSREETLAMIDRQVAEGAWSFGLLYDLRQGTTVPTAEDVQQTVLHVGRLTTKHGPRGPVALARLSSLRSPLRARHLPARRAPVDPRRRDRCAPATLW